MSNFYLVLKAISSRPARNLGLLPTQTWIYTIKESFRLYKSPLEQLLFFGGCQILLENDRKRALFEAFQSTFSFLKIEFPFNAPNL